jgi:cytochrome c
MKALVTAAVAAGVIFALSGDKVAAQDAAKGEIVFKTCMACHRIGPKATNLVGPVLNDLIGRQAGTVPAFRYSPLNKHAGENGLVWNEDLIFDYLADPTGFLKKFLTEKGKPELAVGATLMPIKLPDAQQRKDVIAYIKQFSPPK